MAEIFILNNKKFLSFPVWRVAEELVGLIQ